MQPIEVVRWHRDEGNVVALLRRGRTRLHLLTFGYPLRLRSVPLADARYCTPLDIDAGKAVRRFRRYAKGNAGDSVRNFLKTVQA